jgi:hypothetical protein
MIVFILRATAFFMSFSNCSMPMKLVLSGFLAVFLILPFTAVAQTDRPLMLFDRDVPRTSDRELQFIALFYNQWVHNNLEVTQPFFQGQVIGRMFGLNTTTTHRGSGSYFEQRFLPFLIYTPKLMDGKVVLRTSFEIDWTWGDNSYGAAGNQGAAIGADQVNIQTQNVQLEILPGNGWAVNFGLMRMFDNAANPYRTLFDQLASTGYRLAYWGTDGAGINVRKDWDFSRFSVGAYQLWENDIHRNDDVMLYMSTYERDFTKRFSQALSLWYVSDRGNNQGGTLGNGPASAINDLNGSHRFAMQGIPYNADIFWLGTNWAYNPGFGTGRKMLTGFVNGNIGRISQRSNNATLYDVAGFAANVRLGYKYGQTNEDAVLSDLVYASGDRDFTDRRYTGVITGNTWGTPAAIFINHGAYLLFTHGNVVNRFVAAVNDLSNIGYGLTGGTLNYHKAFIPNKLDAKVGGALAYANATPQGGGRHIGSEMNFKLRWTPKILMDIELHGAYLWLGDFYDSQRVNGNQLSRPGNPWTVFLVYRWLML